MKKFVPFIFSTLLVILTLNAAAEPTETRQWVAQSGSSVMASALKISDTQVLLKKKDGSTIEVPLDKFSKPDQLFLKKHFSLPSEAKLGKESGKENDTKSGAARAEGLPHPLGVISGPVTTEKGSRYFVYVPKSLVEGRKAPLLLCSFAEGGKKWSMTKLVPYAETFGWIFAIAVESRNGQGFHENATHCFNVLEHINKTLPIDMDRIHYTGNSGGGAQSIYNSHTVHPAFGIMPDIAYSLMRGKEKTKVVYALGGGYDYNRYATAAVAENHRSNGFHRINSKGHGIAPFDHRGDGVFWMHCKFLEKNKDEHADEAKDFELATLKWLNQIKEENPARAYSNASHFKNIYQPTGKVEISIDTLLRELEKDENNALYHQALIDIDKISGKYFAPIGSVSNSRLGHFNPDSHRAAVKLQEKYGHIPAINEVLEAIKKKTWGRSKKKRKGKKKR